MSTRKVSKGRLFWKIFMVNFNDQFDLKDSFH